jgi:hypothetical protein
MITYSLTYDWDCLQSYQDFIPGKGRCLELASLRLLPIRFIAKYIR